MEYRVGIDLGGTNVAVGVVDENKQIIARASIKTRPERMLDDVIYDIGCCVKEAVKRRELPCRIAFRSVSARQATAAPQRAWLSMPIISAGKMFPCVMSSGRSWACRCAFPMMPTVPHWAR